MSTTSRWRRMFSDAVFLYLLPLLVGVLPWRIGFALLKRVARMPSVFADVVAAAWHQAEQVLPELDRAHFCQRYRLLLLVDRCDSLLCLLRSNRWWQYQVDIQGDSLDRLAPGLLLNSHWGSGNWIWRLLDAHGMPTHFVARRAEIGDIGRGWLSRGYLKWRSWAVHRSGCRGVVYTGGSSGRVLELLREGSSVLGMLDLPARPNQVRAEVNLFGYTLHFPTGLASLATQAHTPIAIISCGLDMESGRRRLYLQVLPAGLEPEEIVRRYATHLQRRIETEPAKWQAWPQAPAYFQAVHMEHADKPLVRQ